MTYNETDGGCALATRRLNIRVDEDAHAMLTLLAEVRGTSVQREVEEALQVAIQAARGDAEFVTAARGRLDRQREALGL